MNKTEEATELFSKGFNWAQSIVGAYGGKLRFDRETVLKIASPFGGGIGRMGETCGAVTGALMVIGLKYGRFTLEDKEAQKKTYELSGQFIEKYKSRNSSSILCRDLLGMDIKAPGAVKIAKEICPRYIKDAVEILEEMLKKEID